MSTYTPIASQTLGSAAASVTFSSIPQGYTDLVLVGSIKTGANAYQPILRFNGDSGSNYSSTVVAGDGSIASSNRHTNQNGIYGNPGPGVGTAGNFWPWIIQIQNYANANVNKTVLHRFNNSQSYVVAGVGLWRNTTAITSITLVAEAGSNDFQSGSTFSLYGIASGQVGTKATGGIVSTDATYAYHTFISSGFFTPDTSLTADVLVVAGGGGGGTTAGGGGGAGGLRLLTSQTISSKRTVIVGSGGSGTARGASYRNALSGTSSSFVTIQTSGGGGGGNDAGVGANGGSGGGGGGSSIGTHIGGTGNAGGYSPVEGFGGGASTSSSPQYAAAGGGGAGGAGSNSPNSTTGGAGGAGTNVYNLNTFTSWLTATSTGVSGYLAGGGGGGVYASGTGGAGGTGGGGAGGSTNSDSGTAGTMSSGSGGGGGRAGGGNGGSGLVIIRYTLA